MKRLRVYIDTSVVGGCLDEEFATESKALMDMVTRGEIIAIVSDLLLGELASAPDDVQQILEALPEETTEALVRSEESEQLRNAYLADHVVGESATEDAHHVALATVGRADLIVSWNFRHIVHLDKIRAFNAVNLREGYGLLEIRSPREVV